MEFKEKLKSYADIINEVLTKYIKKEECPEKTLNAAMEYSLISSGKRLRPILIISAYTLFKADFQITYPFAVAMEMIHNFSLVHDDLPGIDNDDIRHRKTYKPQKISEKQQQYLQVMDF